MKSYEVLIFFNFELLGMGLGGFASGYGREAWLCMAWLDLVCLVWQNLKT
jgi:hypothetical protein